MFIIIYQKSDDEVKVKKGVVVGKWQVDTDEDGSVSMVEDLETAMNRVKDIRAKGGEACLGVIIE